ncbi:MAG TPA: universal stress protein [Chloroflexota bacterium]|nr:universal stress protein [Chloroflexota bacterium]
MRQLASPKRAVDALRRKSESGRAPGATGEQTEPPVEAESRESKHEYTNIVVALDGSREAEAVMPAVEPIARAFNSKITFVCALVPVEDTPTGAMALSEAGTASTLLESVYETHDLIREEDDSYLAGAKTFWTARGLDVECREPRMRAPEAIIEIAREQDADLIALATHARGGIARTMRGSVADEVVRTASCPVLLVRVE